jgi:hypothetical protein
VAAPLLTIQAAANKAQAGDTITVHEGIYRERVNPPRGGTSDAMRITCQSAPGEKVVLTGSELVRGWRQLQNDTWTVTLPNSFFGTLIPLPIGSRATGLTPKAVNTTRDLFI